MSNQQFTISFPTPKVERPSWFCGTDLENIIDNVNKSIGTQTASDLVFNFVRVRSVVMLFKKCGINKVFNVNTVEDVLPLFKVVTKEDSYATLLNYSSHYRDSITKLMYKLIANPEGIMYPEEDSMCIRISDKYAVKFRKENDVVLISCDTVFINGFVWYMTSLRSDNFGQEEVQQVVDQNQINVSDMLAFISSHFGN